MPLAILYRIMFFFFNDTATTEIYTLSLHDALPISLPTKLPPNFPLPNWGKLLLVVGSQSKWRILNELMKEGQAASDRKSTRLNSSHLVISYAVFCLKKKSI